MKCVASISLSRITFDFAPKISDAAFFSSFVNTSGSDDTIRWNAVSECWKPSNRKKNKFSTVSCNSGIGRLLKSWKKETFFNVCQCQCQIKSKQKSKSFTYVLDKHVFTYIELKKIQFYKMFMKYLNCSRILRKILNK